MSAPRISIGLPFYNAASTLADAIRSVFAQTYRDWELLLVDDGSSDRSLEIARAVKDPRVRVFSDGCNKGLSIRLNEIAAAARSDLVARMDADDLMHPDRLAKQLSLFEARPDVDVVGCATYVTDAAWQPRGMRGAGPLDPVPASVIRQGLFVHPTVTARTAWMRAHPYDSQCRRAEDFELWCRTCSSMSAALLPEPLHFYREPVPMNLAAYLESSRSARRLVRVLAPAALGCGRTIALLLRLHLREVAYRLAGPLRLQLWLLQRRSTPLTTTEREHARGIVRTVMQTFVPGLNVRRDVASGYDAA